MKDVDVFAELSNLFGNALRTPQQAPQSLTELPEGSRLREMLKGAHFAYDASEPAEGAEETPQSTIPVLTPKVNKFNMPRRKFTEDIGGEGLTTKLSSFGPQKTLGVPMQNPPKPNSPPGIAAPMGGQPMPPPGPQTGLPPSIPLQNSHPKGGWAGAGTGSASALGPNIMASQLGNGPGVSGFEGRTQGQKVAGHVDRLPGGKGDKADPKNYSRKEIRMGIKEESEHTNNPQVAQEIALDHLVEEPKYYEKMEQTGKIAAWRRKAAGIGEATMSGAMGGMLPGAALGGLLGVGAGVARGNTPEGLGRGVLRGGATGAGAGIGAALGPMALAAIAQQAGMDLDPRMLAAAAGGGGVLGGIAGFHGSGALMGPPAGKTNKYANAGIPMPAAPDAAAPGISPPVHAPSFGASGMGQTAAGNSRGQAANNLMYGKPTSPGFAGAQPSGMTFAQPSAMHRGPTNLQPIPPPVTVK